MNGWTETYRGGVAPWECDVAEHFTIAYYFDRLADASATLAETLRLAELARASVRRFDVRFVRELRAGDSFHIGSGPIALDEHSIRFGHRFIDSGSGETVAWAEETLDGPEAALASEARKAVGQRLVNWPGPAIERRPEPRRFDGFRPGARDRVKPTDLDHLGCFTTAAFVHRFTAACLQTLAAIGASQTYMQVERRGYSTFELTLQISGYPRLGNQILVESGILHLGNSSIRLLHRMSDHATGAEFARLGQFGVQLDLDARRPTALPEAVRAAAAQLLISLA